MEQEIIQKNWKGNKMQKRIAMIGGGNMAAALVAGLVAAGHPADSISVMDRNEDKCTRLHSEYGVLTHMTAGEWLKKADLVVLAVKPQGMKVAIDQIRPYLSDGALFISIAAGLRIKDIARWLGSDRVVRAMPNTPALVKAGVVGLYVPESLEREQPLFVDVLQSMGEVIDVKSELALDLLSTVSGSGPAYVFRFIEALEEAAVKRGFESASARKMAILTVVGAAKLAVQSSDSPAQLRINVTSKGGTTAEALRVMQEHHFMEMMDEAIQAAFDRSQVLADELGKN